MLIPQKISIFINFPLFRIVDNFTFFFVKLKHDILSFFLPFQLLETKPQTNCHFSLQLNLTLNFRCVFLYRDTGSFKGFSSAFSRICVVSLSIRNLHYSFSQNTFITPVTGSIGEYYLLLVALTNITFNVISNTLQNGFFSVSRL